MNLDERIDQATEVFKPSLAERNALRDDIKGVIRDVLEYVKPEQAKSVELGNPINRVNALANIGATHWNEAIREMEAKTKELGL